MELKNKKRIKFAASLAAVAAASAVAVFTLGGFSGPPAGGPPAANTQAGANGGGKRGAAQAAITVNVTYPERETLSRQTDFAGRIEASQTVKVYPDVSGTVAKTYFNAGDTVKKGDLLFEFDAENAETALKQAELSYRKTMNDIESAESGSENALTILKYENAINSAQNNYENARTQLDILADDDFDFAEFRRLRKKLKEAEAKYDDNQDAESWAAYKDALDDYDNEMEDYAFWTTSRNTLTSFENSFDNYLKAVEEYEIYKSMTSGEDAANRDIAREQAELTLQNARKTFANQKVYAPVSGVISAKNINEYDNASSNTATYVISQEGMPTVSFNLSEDGANAMDIGTKVSVFYNGKNYAAEVIELAPEANSSTGLYPAKAQLTEDIGTNRSGSVIKVTAITAIEKDTLTISLDNIYYDGNQAYVFVYDNGVARRVDVTVGMTTADKVSLIEGVSDSDAIITTWHPRLADGASVVNNELSAAK
ncbi:MAG: efflux RND transporter periplasmic adaptor subunit [Oscillospiraceae bacterium]|nr:efflux RND transporter periplasmic adaptor subunit [Oscillospiraceae bacterium]